MKSPDHKDYTTLSDFELLSLLRIGDQPAFTEIYRRYHTLAIAFVYRKVQDEELTKDLVQEFFIGIWTKRASLSLNVSLAGYFITALKNRVFNFFEHQQVESKYIQSLTDFVNTGNSGHTDYLLREKETGRLIEQAIATLPERMRQVFELHRKSGLTYKEIAQRLSLSEKTVNSQMLNALSRLRSKLNLSFLILLHWF